MMEHTVAALFTEVRGIVILRTSPFGDSAKFVGTKFSEVGLMGAPGRHRAMPDLAIWAHQARQISGQALEACRRGY